MCSSIMSARWNFRKVNAAIASESSICCAPGAMFSTRFFAIKAPWRSRDDNSNGLRGIYAPQTNNLAHSSVRRRAVRLYLASH